MKHRLRILPRAENDAHSIFDYLVSHSPEGAIRWWQAFEDATADVADNVEHFGLAPESGVLGIELHQYFFKTPRGRKYRGVFVAVDDEIRVLRIRGPGQPNLQQDELHVE